MGTPPELPHLQQTQAGQRSLPSSWPRGGSRLLCGGSPLLLTRLRLVLVTLEVVADTGHIHKHQVAITAAEIVFNLVVSPELAFLKLSGALGALGLPGPGLLFLR